MRQLEKSYGGSRASWFLGLFTCVSVLLYVIGGMALIANLIGFCYPAVASFKVRFVSGWVALGWFWFGLGLGLVWDVYFWGAICSLSCMAVVVRP